MKKIDKYLELNAFSLNKKQKNKVFFDLIKSLTKHHYDNSIEYKKILDVILFAQVSIFQKNLVIKYLLMRFINLLRKEIKMILQERFLL